MPRHRKVKTSVLIGLGVIFLYFWNIEEVGSDKQIKLFIFLGFVMIIIIYAITKFVEREKQFIETERRNSALRLAEVDIMSGLAFEHYVCWLLNHQGYHANVTKASGDLGVDIIAHSNKAKYTVQVKRQGNNVSRRAVSDAVAGKYHYGCNASMVVTNRYFTQGAIELARSAGCILIDRDELARWIIHSQKDSEKKDNSMQWWIGSLKWFVLVMSFVFCIIAAFLLLSRSETRSNLQTATSNQSKNKQITIEIIEYSNIREGPEMDYIVIDIIPPGIIVEELERHNKWIKVKLSDGKEGWIHSTLVKEL